mmetsp:Transcript_128669/g.191744  ORF Transcript_128669/g.191744 Transcript_128669/m.191744 type:complete len:183 (-) Transcript_128669:26-574(-)
MPRQVTSSSSSGRSAAEMSPAGPLSGAALDGSSWGGDATSPNLQKTSASAGSNWAKPVPEEPRRKPEKTKPKAKPKKMVDFLFVALFTRVDDEDADDDELEGGDAAWWQQQQQDFDRRDKFRLRTSVKAALWCFWLVLVVLALRHLAQCSWASEVIEEVIEDVEAELPVVHDIMGDNPPSEV